MSRAPAGGLFDELQALISDSQALLSATAHETDEEIQRLRGRAEESLGIARERLSSAQTELMGRAREAISSGANYVRDNPWQALALAAAVGLLAGLLLSRLGAAESVDELDEAAEPPPGDGAA